MYDPKAPTTQRALAEYVNPDVARQLLQYAMWRTQNQDEAKDLVSDAFLRVCDPDDMPWDPARGSLFRHMRLVMDEDAREGARWGYGAHVEVDTDHEAFDRAVDPIPLPDAALHHKRKLDWMRTMMVSVIDRLRGKDKVALDVWDLVCKGNHDEPEEYADALGVPPPEIYEALRRLRYHGGKVRQQWEIEERRRMRSLQEADERARKEKQRW